MAYLPETILAGGGFFFQWLYYLYYMYRRTIFFFLADAKQKQYRNCFALLSTHFECLRYKSYFPMRISVSPKLHSQYISPPSEKILNAHPKFLRRSRSLANFARRLKQHMTIRANSGKPKIHDTIGMIIFSGVTETNKNGNTALMNGIFSRFSRTKIIRTFPPYPSDK